MTLTTPNPNHCPVCGSETRVQRGAVAFTHQVSCTGHRCQLRGPRRSRLIDAVSAWNQLAWIGTRVGTPEPQPDEVGIVP